MKPMFWAKWALLGVLILPVAEIAVFIMIATKIGFLTTLAVTLAMSTLGVSMLRSAGRTRVSRFRGAVTASAAGGAVLRPEDVLSVVVGLLWAIPGFLTDLLGALLLVPLVRHRLADMVWGTGAIRRDAGPGAVVDLEPGEWRTVPPPRISDDPPAPKG
jgi:UPF0716 protein FxsA